MSFKRKYLVQQTRIELAYTRVKTLPPAISVLLDELNTSPNLSLSVTFPRI